MIGQAFDETWVQIAGNFNVPVAINNARMSLATIVLAMATEEAGDAKALKGMILSEMVRRHLISF